MTVKRVSKDPPTKRALTRQRLNTLERRTSDRQEKMRRKRKLDVLEALRKLAKDVKSKKLNIPKNTFNYGTIMKMNMNNRSLTVRLSRKVVDALKDVYRKT